MLHYFWCGLKHRIPHNCPVHNMIYWGCFQRNHWMRMCTKVKNSIVGLKQQNYVVDEKLQKQQSIEAMEHFDQNQSSSAHNDDKQLNVMSKEVNISMTDLSL